MGEISDGYGGMSVDDVLVEVEPWIQARAWALCESPVARSRIEDVKQEGRITVWRVYRETGDISQAQSHAHMRMKEVAWRDVLMTGQAPRKANTVGPTSGRHNTVSKVDSIDALIEYGVWDMFASAGLVDDLEMAYHRGEIMEAIAALTPKQRRYVYARFWCGMDTADGLHNNLGVREARNANPFLRRDILWTGSKTSRGAKRHLAEALAHLRDLVASA